MPTWTSSLTSEQGKDSSRIRYSVLMQNEIRLLKIHPGRSEDPIETSLITVDLLQAPSYEAISYVWGTRDNQPTISVDGSVMQIFQGAFQAIHALRRPDSDQIVWIDAVCIDQSCAEERSRQVSMMSDIYGMARSVAVYLGKAIEQTSEAMRLLQYLISPDGTMEQPPWISSKLSKVEDVLQDILERPWFERVWTVQEAALARHTTLICGEYKVSWSSDLRNLRSVIFRIKSAAISPYFSAASGRKSKLDWSPLTDILETQLRQAARREGVILHRNQLDIAYQFRHRECRDPRDNYFAMFGIVESEKGGDLRFTVDYSMSLEQVHQRYTEELMRIHMSEVSRAESPLPLDPFVRMLRAIADSTSPVVQKRWVNDVQDWAMLDRCRLEQQHCYTPSTHEPGETAYAGIGT
jgi:hypothetical protein